MAIFINANSYIDKIWKIDSSNPTQDIIAPFLGAVWVNSLTGELFVYVGVDSNNFAKWVGQKGTYVGNSVPIDILEDRSCLGFFRFENNLIDDAGKYTQVTCVGSEEYDTGITGKCFKFNGSTYIQINNVLNTLPDRFSFSFWFYKTVCENDELLQTGGEINSSASYYTRVCTLDSTTFYVNYYAHSEPIDDYVYNLPESMLNKFNHIVVCVDKIDKKGYFYYNSELLGYESDINITFTYTTYLFLGIESTVNDLVANNTLIDNLRIFNKVLSQAEVCKIYKAERG